jgi:hypothetical protein
VDSSARASFPGAPPRRHGSFTSDGGPELDVTVLERELHAVLDAVSRAAASWAALQPRLSEHALAFTHALVTRAPDVLELIHGKTGAALTDPSMEAVMLAHERTLLTLLGSCVAGQRNLAALAPTLVATGRMHARFGATIRDFLAPCGAALADTLAAALGEAFTADVEAAWAHVFAFVAAHMLQGIDAVSAAGAAEHALKGDLLGAHAARSGAAAGSPR